MVVKAVDTHGSDGGVEPLLALEAGCLPGPLLEDVVEAHRQLAQSVERAPLRRGNNLRAVGLHPLELDADGRDLERAVLPGAHLREVR